VSLFRKRAHACTYGQELQRVSSWGIAWGIGYITSPHAPSVQQFTPDFESRPGSHPETSEEVQGRPPTSSQRLKKPGFSDCFRVLGCSRDVHRLPPAATTFLAYVSGIRDRVPHTRDSLQITRSAQWLRCARRVLFESGFGIRTRDAQDSCFFCSRASSTIDGYPMRKAKSEVRSA
jgi:hypothetical protein